MLASLLKSILRRLHKTNIYNTNRDIDNVKTSEIILHKNEKNTWLYFSQKIISFNWYCS